jgi:hypothetical protein
MGWNLSEEDAGKQSKMEKELRSRDLAGSTSGSHGGGGEEEKENQE